jgi:valyl-tRNA synthetase
MNIPTHYDAKKLDPIWYQYWLTQDFFKARPNPTKKPYTIVMPPPNVTGVLHMGHVLNNTVQDVLIRRARMQGYEACWVPGLDHASIATEARVVSLLKERGLQKKDLTREEFLCHAWEWKEKYGSLILQQIQQLGASCDWDRLHFTMDPGPSLAVKNAFIQLYQQGYIYKGTRMIHWDPIGRTALSDDEVIYKPVDTQLYYIHYPLVDSNQKVTIATTRPETLLGDTAICIHPEDARYQHLQGKQARVPLIQRVIPIITDAYVDKDFGTGCLKVTPAHDMHDYTLSQRHHLPIIDIFNEDGTLSVAAQYYVGEDRMVAREKIVQYLQSNGYLVKIEPHTSAIGFSERTHAVVEPRISKQWFVRIQELAKPALAHVLDGTIQFHPSKFKHMYQSWLENVQDWCISRQLWWGHQIPAFYLPDGAVIVAADKAAALAQAKTQPAYQNLTLEDLQQDEDVLDTWFSAWLWPITVLEGWEKPTSTAISYFYPTQVVVTAPEIIFFWIARMIMAGYAFTEQPPFQHVYFTGIVRDKLGRKMSKSLGNSPDPLALIETYGADGVRIGMLLCTPAGNDLLFDTKLCEQGRNFAHKLWNVFRLIKGWQVAADPAEQQDNIAITWFRARLNQALEAIDNHFEQFRVSDALMVIYKLVWDDFCAWYLEMIKPSYGQPIHASLYRATLAFCATLLKVLHPFMPFITEEIWYQLEPRSSADCLIVAPWPRPEAYQPAILQEASFAFSLITAIRNLRAQAQLAAKEEVLLGVPAEPPAWFLRLSPYICKLGGVVLVALQQLDTSRSSSCHVDNHLFYMALPEQRLSGQERLRLEKELHYYQGFLDSVSKKLNNPQFVRQAPASVIALEEKKQADANAKIQLITGRLTALCG